MPRFKNYTKEATVEEASSSKIQRANLASVLLNHLYKIGRLTSGANYNYKDGLIYEVDNTQTPLTKVLNKFLSDFANLA